MSDLGSFKVCGLRNSSSFVDATRVKNENSSECSNPAMEACNPNASPENIICVSDLSQCGITDIKVFTTENDMNAFLNGLS